MKINSTFLMLIIIFFVGCKKTSNKPDKTNQIVGNKIINKKIIDNKIANKKIANKKIVEKFIQGDKTIKINKNKACCNLKMLSPKQIILLKSIKNELSHKVKEHFYTSNEKRYELFFDVIKNIGGAYIGVASDQNYTFASVAKSELVFLVDYDGKITLLHELYMFLTGLSATPKEFIKNVQSISKKIFLAEAEILYGKKSIRMWNLLKSEKRRLLAGFVEHYKLAKRYNAYTWLTNKNTYKYWKRLVETHRVYALTGDFRKCTVLNQITKRLKEINLPIRILYLSNMENYWKIYPENFKNFILNMFTDDKAIILRSIHLNGFNQADKLYHYSYQKVSNFRLWFKKYKSLSSIYMFKKGASSVKSDYFSEIEAPH